MLDLAFDRAETKDNLVLILFYKNLTLNTLDLALDRTETIDLNEQR